MKQKMNLFIKFGLLVICIGFISQQIDSATALPNSFDYIDLMTVQNLTFYRDYYTIGNNRRAQLNCTSANGDECEHMPNKFFCVNNDYQNYSRVNATRLNWSCKPSQLLNTYYVAENTEDVQCEEGNRTSTQRPIISGSCSLSFTLVRTPVYRSWLFFIIAVLVLLLVISLIFYLRQKKRRSGYVTV